ncbi:MAG: tyrosine-type recombinase/integrase [Candidatus Puniceispirillaceae bacterium]
MKNLKDLKKFKGNQRGADFKLEPAGKLRSQTSVEQIRKLRPDQVNVLAKIQKPNAKKGVFKFHVICRLDQLPDTDQLTWIIGKIQQIKNEQLIKNDAVPDADAVVTIKTLINKYKLEVLVHKKDVWTASQRLDYWAEQIGDEDVKAQDLPAKISACKRNLRDTVSGATVNRYLSCLSQAFSYGIKELFWCTINPVKLVTKYQENGDINNWLREDQLAALLAEVEKSESDQLKDLVIFCLSTGCRISEAKGLHWHDIDFTNNKINFTHARRRVLAAGATEVDGKVEYDYVKDAVDEGLKNGNSIKVLDISEQPELRQLLLERKLRSSTDLVFPNVDGCRKSWANALRRAGIKGFRFHDLRHTCASYLLQSGKSLVYVGAYLGHKGIASTQRYAHHADELSKEAGGILSKRIYKKG